MSPPVSVFVSSLICSARGLPGRSNRGEALRREAAVAGLRAPGKPLPGLRPSTRIAPACRRRAQGRPRRPIVIVPGAPQRPALRARSALPCSRPWLESWARREDLALSHSESRAHALGSLRGFEPRSQRTDQMDFFTRSRGAGVEPATHGVCVHCSTQSELSTLALRVAFVPVDTMETSVLRAPGRRAEPTPLVTIRLAQLVQASPTSAPGRTGPIERAAVLSRACGSCRRACLCTREARASRVQGDLSEITAMRVRGSVRVPLVRLAVRRRDEGRTRIDHLHRPRAEAE